MEKMINKWLSAGIINQNIANVLLADVKREKDKQNKIRMNILIYTLAAIFLGTGVITFISANDWLIKFLMESPIIQILLLTILTISSLIGGYNLAFEKKKFPQLGHSLIILSSLLIGGTYALIGQTYNIDANNTGLMFLWLISILPLAYIFKNNAINIICIILFYIGINFFYWDLRIDKGFTWTIFMPTIIGITLYTIGNIPIIKKEFEKFSTTYKIIGLLPIFTTLFILTCSTEDSYQLISPFYLIPIAILFIINLGYYLFSKEKDNLLQVETGFLLGFLTMLLLALVLPNVNEIIITILANIAIIAMISAGYNFGIKNEKQSIVTLTNWFLIIYLTTNYCRWGWSYMEKSLFFLLGGLGLLSIGIYLEQTKKQLFKKGK